MNLKVALFTLFILALPTHSLWAADEHVHGAPRTEYGACKSEIPAFQKSLQKVGLNPVPAVRCANLDGEPHAFAPFFKVSTLSPIQFEKVIGQKFSSISFCELERLKLVQEWSVKTKVLESSCKHIKEDELFQPLLIVVKKNPTPTSLAAAE